MQLPNKSTKDVIALFYVWKRHGSCATYHDYDDDIPDLELPAETKYLVDQLRRTLFIVLIEQLSVL